MTIRRIQKYLRIAQSERDASAAKCKLYQQQMKFKSSLVYAIRADALELYIQQLQKKLLAEEAKKQSNG